MNMYDTSNDDPAQLPSSSEWVRQNFVVGDLLGSGTFGKVYQVECRRKRNQLYALKELSRGSLPKYIATELKVLHKYGGRCNVMQMHAAYRDRDRVFIVMDHFPHLPLKDVIAELTTTDVIDYMKNLFIALEYLHRYNIIHRDIKPANFLFNRLERKYSLIDFGLSHEYKQPIRRDIRRSFAPPNHQLLQRHVRTNLEQTGRISPNENKTPMTPSNVPPAANSMLMDVIHRRSVKRFAGYNDSPVPSSRINSPALKRGRFEGINDNGGQGVVQPECLCYDQQRICSVCKARPSKQVNKAGTPGFRAPEILMRFDDQTTKLDIWSAGVTMLSLLLKRHPVFRPADDIEALAQIARIVGIDELEQVAAKEGINLTFEPYRHFLGVDIVKLMLIARDGLGALEAAEQAVPRRTTTLFCGDCVSLISGNTKGLCVCKKNEKLSTSTASHDIQLCIFLLTHCLKADPCRRFSASMLLNIIQGYGF